MKQIKYLPIYVVLVTLAVIVFIIYLVHFAPLTVLIPQGTIAKDERNLMYVVIGLMMLLAIPSIVLTYYFAWKYRADNPKRPAFEPERIANKKMTLLWWAIPTFAAIVLSVITWVATHDLDVYKPLVSSAKPLKVEVIALQWKWVFIYPEQHIATVNFLEIPTNRPIDFALTADAPMTSFWIPNLGGQIYAMNGMQTQTHFITKDTGDFTGQNAEINGDGYSEMDFKVRAASEQNFDNWVTSIKKGKTTLDQKVYNDLAKPTDDVAPLFYSSVDPNLFRTVLLKDMVAPTEPMNMGQDNTMKGMDMSHMDMSK